MFPCIHGVPWSSAASGPPAGRFLSGGPASSGPRNVKLSDPGGKTLWEGFRNAPRSPGTDSSTSTFVFCVIGGRGGRIRWSEEAEQGINPAG